MNVVSPKQDSFPWCGYAINMTDLSVAVDYVRYANSRISDSLTVVDGRTPGRRFSNKMLMYAVCSLFNLLIS
ncbi:hypothetical protein EV361DRAFT_879703 [Lentinula raphanica]|nr:hypothetical protein EV361DRAFT_879703 [Lentinula raphanica]